MKLAKVAISAPHGGKAMVQTDCYSEGKFFNVTRCRDIGCPPDCWRATHRRTGYAMPGHYSSPAAVKKAIAVCQRRVPEVKEITTIKEWRKRFHADKDLTKRLLAVKEKLLALAVKE